VKAVLLKSFRQPIELGEASEPAALNDGEVLLAVEAAGVCFKDVLIVDGFQPRVKLPVALGHEAAGRIEAIGSGVSGFKVGDRVCSLGYLPCGTCGACRAGSEHICRNRKWLGEDQDGAYASHVRSHVHALVKIPDRVTFESAAAATCATGTVVHGLTRLGQLQAGQTVLITGAAGAVGSNAVLVAKALGARTIATDMPGKAEQVQGADEIVPFSDQLSARVKQLTGGEGVDLVLEAVGTPTFEQGLRSLRWGGRIVVIGNVAPADSIPLALGSVILRENAILGCMNSTKADLTEALRLIDDGKLTPITATVLPLEDAQYAHDLMRQRKSIGKIILRP
jgi:acryloyl-coenzyme A reductase